MGHELALEAKSREIVGKAVRGMRKQGQLPLILYGKGIDSKVLSATEKQFATIYRQAGQSSLIDIKIGSAKPVKALIHDIQRDPVTGQILHADLYQVNMTEKVKTEVPLKFSGEAAAVKELEGTLVTQKDHVTIEALPGDLIPEIEVDISPLQTFEDTIKVTDIKAKLPATITVADADEEVVALVTPPRTEEELAELEAPPVTEEEQVAALEQQLESEKAAAEAAKAEGEEGVASGPTEPEARREAPAKETHGKPESPKE